MTLSERVRLFDFVAIESRSSPPRPPRTTTTASSRRRLRNAAGFFADRFQTQPITVDEVQEASRRQRMETARSSEQFSALRASFIGGEK